HAEHDDVLFHWNRQTGQRPRGKSSYGARTRTTDKSLQSKSVSARAVGNAFHNGNDDYWRWRSHASIMDAPSIACPVGSSFSVLQHCRVLERSEIHDRE